MPGPGKSSISDSAITENKLDGCKCACLEEWMYTTLSYLKKPSQCLLGELWGIAIIRDECNFSGCCGEIFIRLMTFEELDITRTCCDWDDEAQSAHFHQDQDVIQGEEQEEIHT